MCNFKNICKNTFVILLIYTFITYMIPFNMAVAATNMTVTGPSIVLEGQSAVFNVVYSSDVIYINLSSGDIVLNGFQATVSVSGSGNSRKITLNNVRGIGTGRSITIASGTGYVGENKIVGTTSNTFKIKSANVTNPVTNPTTNNNNNNNVQKPAENNTNKDTNNQNNNVNNNTNNNDNISNENNNTQTEIPNEEQKEDVKPEENINYDEIIPIPNTGK